MGSSNHCGYLVTTFKPLGSMARRLSMLKIIGEMTSFSNEWCGLVGLFPLGLGPLVRGKSLCYLFDLAVEEKPMWLEGQLQL